MSKKLSQTPKNAAIVEKITTFSSRLASKNYGQKYNAKDREVSRAKIPICPLLPLAIDTHTITVKRDGIHTCILFHKNLEFTRDAKNSLFHPDYELPHLIPPIIRPLQRETRGALSEVHWIYGTVISLPPDKSLSYFSEKHEVPFLKWIGFKRPPINIYTHEFPGTNDTTRNFTHAVNN